MKRIIYLAVIALISIGFTACSDDNSSPTNTTASKTLVYTEPAGLENPVLSNIQIVVTDIATGVKTTLTESKGLTVSGKNVTFTLPSAAYRLAFTSTLTYVVDGVTKTAEARYEANSIIVNEATASTVVPIQTYFYNTSDIGNGFVIAEIFATSSINKATQKGYNRDTYIRIYNNSSDTLYADKLCFMESDFTTNTKYTYTPDVMSTDMSIQALYRIPGTGKDHPVPPGGFILLADVGKNHNVPDTLGYMDLSKADFEWYDVSNSPQNLDTDVPEVPNMEKIYCYSNSYFMLSTQTNRAYAIGYLGGDPNSTMTAKEYTEKYAYKYSFFVPSTGSQSKEFSSYKFPNSWIIDGVNLAPKANYAWGVMASSIDAGFTYTRDVARDVTGLGLAVRRKVLSGKTLKDTNNSTNDFEPRVKADPAHNFFQ